MARKNKKSGNLNVPKSKQGKSGPKKSPTSKRSLAHKGKGPG